MSGLIKKTKNELAMVVGSLSGEVSDHTIYLKEIEKAIRRGVKISILFLQEPNRNSLLLAELLKYKNWGKDIKFYRGNGNTNRQILEYFPKYELPVHFAVFDDDKVRVEISPNDYVGFGVINDKEYATGISKFYKEKLISHSTEIFR